jgi:hypothetical protein
MPLGKLEAVALVAGGSCIAATTYFFRQRSTLLFKCSYAASWVVAGSALIMALSPSDQEIEKLRAKYKASHDEYETRDTKKSILEYMKKEAESNDNPVAKFRH